MGYTKFGEYVRMLRIQNHEVMGDMAQKLNVSVPFLSAVETGKKNIPLEWKAKISELYKLDDIEIKKLEHAIESSKCQIKVQLSGMPEVKRQVALKFARSFNDMDSQTAERIMQILEDHNNGL